MIEAPNVDNFDVTVIGGGLAGMAASLHLAKAGFRVVCIEPQTGVRQPVGESLDWASPGLLARLGLPLEYLIDSGIATYKRGVTLQIGDEHKKNLRPAPWLGRAPFHAAMLTIHVDRVRLDREIQDLVSSHNIAMVYDQAAAVEANGMRVISVETASGRRFASPWFIDASGSFKSLLARHFNLPETAYGPRKVALWDYFSATPEHEGTTIYMEPTKGAYQDWIWEIPIAADTLSVGYVAPGDEIRKQREQGLAVADIFQTKLDRFSRLRWLSRKVAASNPNVTSFNCRTYLKVAGPNWIITGEAASMVDPITSNGVTSALRTAEEAAAMITAFRSRPELAPRARRFYSKRVLQIGKFFNGGIEMMIYDWPVRDRLGLMRAARIYTAAAWIMNGVYSKWRPRKTWSTVVFGALLDALRLGAGLYYRLCRTRR